MLRACFPYVNNTAVTRAGPFVGIFHTSPHPIVPPPQRDWKGRSLDAMHNPVSSQAIS